MSIQYVGTIEADVGEKFHVRSIVKPKCEEELSFTIRNAKWELYDSEGIQEASGECIINGHELDALIQPQTTGTYKFKYIYEVADEIWIDCVKVKVS